MAKLSSVRIDREKVSKGVWMPYEQGIECLIARSRNPEFDAFVQSKISPEGKAQSGKVELSEKDYEEIFLEGTARHILLGWRNVDDEGEYTPERGITLFKDPEYADFYQFVLEKSNRKELFRVHALEAVAKN